MAENTTTECMKAAFEAICRGDYAERDRLIERVRVLDKAEREAAAITKVMLIDFYVTRAGVSIPTVVMAKAAGAIH